MAADEDSVVGIPACIMRDTGLLDMKMLISSARDS